MIWVQQEGRRAVALWLWIVAGLIITMIALGGLTRLTDSGLSMVEWRVVGGTIPPLNEQQWQEAFDAYRQFPEYQLTRKGMQMDEFKFIFFMEWFHRVFGRLIGLAFFFPFLYFVAVKKWLTKPFIWRLTGLFLLGGLQGFVGWLMVKSGLVDKPHVSHYRLVAHLSLALASLSFSLWYAFKLSFPPQEQVREAMAGMRKPALVVAIMLAVQIMGGGMVAGLHGGHSYNTFPRMLGYWLPPAALDFEPMLRNFLDNPVMLQCWKCDY